MSVSAPVTARRVGDVVAQSEAAVRFNVVASVETAPNVKLVDNVAVDVGVVEFEIAKAAPFWMVNGLFCVVPPETCSVPALTMVAPV